MNYILATAIGIMMYELWDDLKGWEKTIGFAYITIVGLILIQQSI